MLKELTRIVGIVTLGTALAACSNTFWQPVSSPSGSNTTTAANGEEKPIELSGAPVADSAPLAGGIESSMNENDRTRLSRALDGGIGKETHWTSGTGIAYTVVPTRKISVGGNNLCRKYTITASRGGSRQQVNGSACVGSDGAWHTV